MPPPPEFPDESEALFEDQAAEELLEEPQEEVESGPIVLDDDYVSRGLHSLVRFSPHYFLVSSTLAKSSLELPKGFTNLIDSL